MSIRARVWGRSSGVQWVAMLCCAGLVTACAADSRTLSLRDARSPAFRAFWADAFHPGFKSASECNTLLARALQGRYNAVVVEVLAYHYTGGNGAGAYWNSSIVPKAGDISGSFDPLSYLVTQGHALGLEVHAWIVPYRVSTSWPPAGNSTVAAHPEWVMVSQADMGGGPEDLDGRYWLDPGSPGVQEYVTSIIRELVSNYDIDGINLDYIRYPQTNAGYPAYTSTSDSSLARFRALTGYSGTPPYEGETAWNDFRRQTISELVRRALPEIAAASAGRDEPVILTADLFATGGAPADFADSQAYALHQNWKHWLEQGWLDAGMPMNYKREWSPQQAQWYRSWVDAAVAWSSDRHVYCGQANYLNPKADSVDQMTYVLNSGAQGVCNYSYVGTADENMDGSWESDWSWYSYVASELFTSTVSVPHKPWRDPATADAGTLWGRVMNLSTGQPIDGLPVRVLTLGSIETDGNGYFVYSRVPAAVGGTTYDVEVLADGCDYTLIENVELSPGEFVRLDIDVCVPWAGPGDMNEDGRIDADDVRVLLICMIGPEWPFPPNNDCVRGDADGDLDLDLADIANFQLVYEGT